MLAGYGVAGLGPACADRAGSAAALARAAFTAAFHLVVSGWERALVVIGTLAVLVLLAALVTLTTRTTDLVDVVVRGCRPAAQARGGPGRGSG